MKRSCSIDGCERPVHARGWCAMHWQRWWKRGDPSISLTPTLGMTPTQRFWCYVDPCRTDGCMVWTSYTTQDGYGQLSVQGRTRMPAHHFLAGRPPSGLVYDHLCRRRNCVNPDHLELVTSGENTRRGLYGALKTHCVNGHPWVPENMYIQPGTGRRACYICKRQRDRRRAAQGAVPPIYRRSRER